MKTKSQPHIKPIIYFHTSKKANRYARVGFKRHLYDVTASYSAGHGCRFGTCFQLRGQPLTEAQALKIARILLPGYRKLTVKVKSHY